jgi:hypothetical protein
LRLSRGHDNVIREESATADEERERTESLDEQMMFMVFDKEDGTYMDIREIEKEICVVDSTTFFDKRTARKFTTISKKSKFRSMWEDFWSKKDKTNIKLIKAAAIGDTKTIKKLLNKLRDGEKVADVSYCDESGF